MKKFLFTLLGILFLTSNVFAISPELKQASKYPVQFLDPEVFYSGFFIEEDIIISTAAIIQKSGPVISFMDSNGAIIHTTLLHSTNTGMAAFLVEKDLTADAGNRDVLIPTLNCDLPDIGKNITVISLNSIGVRYVFGQISSINLIDEMHQLVQIPLLPTELGAPVYNDEGEVIGIITGVLENSIVTMTPGFLLCTYLQRLRNVLKEAKLREEGLLPPLDSPMPSQP